MKLLTLSIMIYCCILPGMVRASGSVVFTRDTLIIQSKQAVDVPQFIKDAQAQANGQNDNVPPPAISHVIRNHELTVTLRNADTAENAWITGDYAIKNDAGIMLVYDQPQPVAVMPGKNDVPYDIFFVDAYGDIVGIATDISLASLIEPLRTDRLIKAVLFTASGTKEQWHIAIHDKVIHSLFAEKPHIELD